MLKTEGLSLEQAPPIHIPFRFFLTAPAFLLAAALVLLWQGESVLASRWTPAALAVTHLIAVGFLGQIMCGALLQMLPVVAGAVVPAVHLVGATVNPLLAAGAALLAWGFLENAPGVLAAGAVCASLGFLVFLSAAGLALARAQGATHTVRAMGLAFGSLLLTVVLGLAVTGALNGWIPIAQLLVWVDVHLAWGLLGWVGLLVIGVAFQIVPMFYVTPPYPERLSRWLAPLIAILLALSSLMAAAGASQGAGATMGGAVLALCSFAVLTIGLQLRRERRRIDATLLYWWSAMGSVVLAAASWAFSGPPVLTGILLLLGAGVGVVSGMSLKIVPFLAWFHLQNRQLTSGRLDVRVPHMLTFLPERPARAQLACHLLALSTVVAASFIPGISELAGVTLALSSAALGGLILTGVLRYSRIAAVLGAD